MHSKNQKNGREIKFYIPKGSTEEKIKEKVAELLANEEAEKRMEKEREYFEKRIPEMKKQLTEELEQKYCKML